MTPGQMAGSYFFLALSAATMIGLGRQRTGFEAVSMAFVAGLAWPLVGVAFLAFGIRGWFRQIPSAPKRERPRGF
jgi:nitrate reductase NapE component